MKLFDTHVYLGLMYEDKIERLVVVKEAKMKGVSKFLNITNRLDEFKSVYESLKSDSSVYFAAGISPVEISYSQSDWQEDLCQCLKKERVVAVGETGLDSRHSNKVKQVESFIYHLDLAQKFHLPVIVHNRELGIEVLDILKNQMPLRGGVLHCFSDSWELAKKAIDLNLYLSFAGNLTYSRSGELHKVAKQVPLDRVVIESESPFMIPHTVRSKKRNHPAYLSHILDFFCSLRSEDPDLVREAIYNNSLNLFGVS